ncbi:MAG: IS200/IS605 family transposase [bacterium]|nr:MAG: IS200/IS605 family transposase [bacterium]
MPYIKIWIHLIWTTKNRYPFIKKQIRSQVISHIRENAKKKYIHLDFINAVEEHVHSLISLNADQSIAKVAQLLKGESSHWINKNKLTPTEFGWQDEYIAVSVSHSIVNKVREYIKNQEEHHRKKSFEEEYQLFLKKYGFDILGKTKG